MSEAMGVGCEVRRRFDAQTKPPGSLGVLEEVVVRIAEACGTADIPIDPVAAVLFAGDHGVCVHGVSAYPQEVTRQMVLNFARGGAAASVLAGELGVELTVMDCGVVGGRFEAVPERAGFQFRDARAGEGTADLLAGPAVSDEQFESLWEAGRGAALEAVADGAETLVAGEMGIGNTTAASALACGLGFGAVDELVGHGTGVSEEGLNRKRAVLLEALRLHAISPEKTGLELMRHWLARVGGFEMVAMAGFFQAGLEARKVVVVDGFIASSVAAAVSVGFPKLCPGFVFAHVSAERGHRVLLERMGVSPLLDLGMRLGEGTGALMAIPLLRQAVALYRGMATFQSAGVSHSR
jgi:nicotinate-nucleotide--dimethylbenzimidazole phosphoribosyltransferase